ncbi:MAG: YigZ family protein [Oscillospiraceae bacterium]|nr:YigZ family protein [Oscillospiraceae bacterium]
MESYIVPFQEAETEMVEKRSRFIGHIWKVESEEQARAYIEETKKKHYDARHNCWCYILREGNILRYSDDGEPQGTAGQPMLNVFLREEVTNVCCVVTRYFGGILLGAGGLTRAYGGTAKLALNESGISRMRLWASLAIPCSYALYERMRLTVEQSGGIIMDTDFGADIVLTVMLPAEEVDSFCEKVTELSAGSVEPLLIEKTFQAGPREDAR